MKLTHTPISKFFLYLWPVLMLSRTGTFYFVGMAAIRSDSI